MKFLNLISVGTNGPAREGAMALMLEMSKWIGTAPFNSLLDSIRAVQKTGVYFLFSLLNSLHPSFLASFLPSSLPSLFVYPIGYALRTNMHFILSLNHFIFPSMKAIQSSRNCFWKLNVFTAPCHRIRDEDRWAKCSWAHNAVPHGVAASVRQYNLSDQKPTYTSTQLGKHPEYELACNENTFSP